MSRLINLKSLLAATLVAGGLMFASSTAKACDDYAFGYSGSSYGGSLYSVGYVPEYHWRTVVSYETQTVPVVDYVVKYDCYGDAYRVKVISYKTVRVPVETQVRVSY